MVDYSNGWYYLMLALGLIVSFIFPKNSDINASVDLNDIAALLLV